MHAVLMQSVSTQLLKITRSTIELINAHCSLDFSVNYGTYLALTVI